MKKMINYVKARIIAGLFLLSLLSGCATAPTPVLLPKAPPPVTLPPLPSTLAPKAEALPPIAGNDVKDLIADNAETSSRYNSLRFRYNAFIDFYGCVREAIADQSKDLDACLK